MPIGEAQMPLFAHLGELRRRLTIVLVTVVVTSCVFWILFSDSLVLFLVQPIGSYLLNGKPVDSLDDLRGALSILTPLGGFSIRFKVAFIFAVLVTCPVWTWQILAFFLPALKPNERKWVIPTFFAAIILWVFGMVFCYLIILDPAFEWMISQSTDIASVVADASLYVNTIILFELAFGIAFELPLVVFYLTVFKIVSYQKLRGSWRYVYIGLLVVSAMVTPDFSPVTMLMMFAAMLGLYEGSLLVARMVLSARNRAEAKGIDQ
jgi:sec-independent protein translocase protein TatC